MSATIQDRVKFVLNAAKMIKEVALGIRPAKDLRLLKSIEPDETIGSDEEFDAEEQALLRQLEAEEQYSDPPDFPEELEAATNPQTGDISIPAILADLKKRRVKINIPEAPYTSDGKTQKSHRNNNPGNLRFARQKGAVESGGFAKFATPLIGYAALLRQIELDRARNLTLREYIYKFAPPSENDTENYINRVAKYTKSTPSTNINTIDRDLLAEAQVDVECQATVIPSAIREKQI